MPAPEPGHLPSPKRSPGFAQAGGAAWLEAAASPCFDLQHPPVPPQTCWQKCAKQRMRQCVPTEFRLDLLVANQQAGDDGLDEGVVGGCADIRPLLGLPFGGWSP